MRIPAARARPQGPDGQRSLLFPCSAASSTEEGHGVLLFYA